jgi:exodeoxyribonuclease III
VRIIALNIRHGGGKRIRKLVEYLAGFKPELVVLTEFRENSNAPIIEQAFRDVGLVFLASARPRKHSQNSVCMLSSIPIIARTHPELGEANLHRVVSVDLNGFAVHGAYFPGKQEKASVFDFFLKQAASLKDKAQLIIGDLNTGLHLLDERGATFHCAAKFQAMTSEGYVDSWRSRNPGKREFSWYSHAGNGFRIDHAFATPLLDRRIRAIHYDHEPRQRAITDHSALHLEID